MTLRGFVMSFLLRAAIHHLYVFSFLPFYQKRDAAPTCGILALNADISQSSVATRLIYWWIFYGRFIAHVLLCQ